MTPPGRTSALGSRPAAPRAAGLAVWLTPAVALGLFLAAGASGGTPGPVPEDRACLRCHADPALTRTAPGPGGRGLYVDPAVLRGSRHARVPCTGCHQDVAALPHVAKPGRATCGGCHQPEAQAYAASIHGRRLGKADTDVPTCQRCHGGHDIRAVTDPRSRVQPLAQAKICMDCHADTRMTARHPEMPNVLLIRAYADSVHGRAMAKSGLAVAASCTACHGTHSLRPADDPASPVHRLQVAETCGRCHQGILTEYQDSVHAAALARGAKDAPTCTSCHGEHTIAAPAEASSRVAPRNIPKTCGGCHASERIVRTYGLPTQREETYADSFHGIAVKYGNREAANCASCHGFHAVRPSSDPRSTVARENLPRTCGKCHPGAGARFAEGRVHIDKTLATAPGVFYVRTFYTWFIGGLLVCFLGYMAVELYGYRRRRPGAGAED